MNRLVLSILFLPQLLYAQYQSKEFMLPDERNTTGVAMGLYVIKDSLVELRINQPVSGFFISGATTFENSCNSYTRVTIKDRSNVEYLVYENYPLLSGSNHSRFSRIAIETLFLNNIIPSSMKIETSAASIQIDSVYFTAALNLRHNYQKEAESIRQEQSWIIVEQLNARLRENNLPWFAACTSISLKSFEEKKEMFGSKVPCLFGFDYYKGGLYIASPILDENRHVVRQNYRTNVFVRDFDWRNRHGKNWITSIKRQHYNTCWAYASTATIESNFNIYLNQILSENINNLSEQELVSCLDNDYGSVTRRLQGGYAKYALDYVVRNGIVTDSCFPFQGDVPCEGKCSTPIEQVSFSSFRKLCFSNPMNIEKISYSDSVADSLKTAVIKSPVVVDYFGDGGGHSLSCVGFHQIQMGDTIYGDITNYDMIFIVDSTLSYLVDQIGWVIKNSWGTDWGENGFARMAFNGAKIRMYELSPPFTSLIYSDINRYVLDEDMDGYYSWGSGSKPANLPVWIPDEQDGDDSNPNIGPIDEYGNCDTLITTPAITWYIDTAVDYSYSDTFTYPHIVVMQGGSLTIENSTLAMKQNSVIEVRNGGRLIIDGGIIYDAYVVIKNGGELILKNGGLLRLRHDGQYITQVGAKVLINNGKIEKY